jgi:hypothetical protein
MGIVKAVGANEESSDADAEHDKGEARGPAEARPAQQITLPIASVSAPPTFAMP